MYSNSLSLRVDETVMSQNWMQSLRSLNRLSKERQIEVLDSICDSSDIDESSLDLLKQVETLSPDPNYSIAWIKCVGKALGKRSFEELHRYLRHSQDLVRKATFETIFKSGVNLKDFSMLRVVLNFVGDPSPKVVKVCLNILDQTVSREELSAVINNYFDPGKPRVSLNCLYLVYQYELIENGYIFEVCLSHKDEAVRAYSAKLLPLFEKKNPSARELLLRSREGETQESLYTGEDSDLTKLKQVLASEAIRDKIDFLQHIDENHPLANSPGIGEFLVGYLSACRENFVVATLVKTIARIDVEDHWGVLSPYLSHGDPRIVSNTVEALAERGQEQLLPYLESLLREGDFHTKEDVRTLTSGLKYLHSCNRKLTLLGMEKLSQGNVNAVSAFVRYLHIFEEEDTKDLIPIVVRTMAREVREDVLFECSNFLAKYAGKEVLAKIQNLVSGAESPEKKEILNRLVLSLKKRFGVKEGSSKSKANRGKEKKLEKNTQLLEELGIQSIDEIEPHPLIANVKAGAVAVFSRLVSSPWILFCVLLTIFSGLGFLIIRWLEAL